MQIMGGNENFRALAEKKMVNDTRFFTLMIFAAGCFSLCCSMSINTIAMGGGFSFGKADVLPCGKIWGSFRSLI